MTYVHNGVRYIGTEREEPVALVPLALSRLCDRCGKPTWFARPRQTKKGQHPLCDPEAYVDVLTPDGERDLLRLFMRVFPGSTVTIERKRR